MLPKFINLRITWSTLVSENYIINIASIMIEILRLVHQNNYIIQNIPYSSTDTGE